MAFRRLPLVCECGRVPSHFKSVGLTSARELVVHWRCAACRRSVQIAIPLSDCWRACPDKEDPAAVGVGCEFLPDDLVFLRSIHIKV